MKRVICFFLGHQYGPQRREDPDWILSRLCARCRVTRIEMDEERFAKLTGLYARGGVVPKDTLLPLPGESGCEYPPRKP